MFTTIAHPFEYLMEIPSNHLKWMAHSLWFGSCLWVQLPIEIGLSDGQWNPHHSQLGGWKNFATQIDDPYIYLLGIIYLYNSIWV